MDSQNLAINKAESNDPFCRYKMPPLKLKKEGNKSVILNLTAVAGALDRPPEMIMAFLKSQLGTGIVCKGDRFTLNGINNTIETLQDILYDFINNYVLCIQCFNPETTINNCESSKTVYEMTCKACGLVNRLNISKFPQLKFHTNATQSGGLTKKQQKYQAKVLAQQGNCSK